MHIIPKPLKTEKVQGVFKFNSELKMFYHPSCRRAADKLNEFINEQYNFTLEAIEHQDRNFVIAQAHVVEKKTDIAGNEAYTLEVGDNIVINGGGDAGVFYGVITLCQMLENSLILPCCRIEDAPAMSMRGIHWDLKGNVPTFEYLKAQIKRYAYFKVNTILAEYENVFKYDNHPVLNSPDALSKSQVKELIELAKANYIEIIPLVQSLGHAEYILRHDEYSYVAETPDGKISQMCPSNPATFELFKSFVDELLEVHDSKYIHIGGDETRQLGECDKCAAVVAESSDIDLYFSYVEKCCDYIVSRGLKPIIWDDMLCRRFRLDLLKQLPKETVICCWEYQRTDNKHPFFILEHDWVFSRQYADLKNNDLPGAGILIDYYKRFPELCGKNCKFYEELDSELRKKIAPYVEINESPEFFDSFPAVKLVDDSGLESICAPATYSSFHNFSNSLKNIQAADKCAANNANSARGAIVTSWARFDSSRPVGEVQETRFYSYVMHAEHAWSAGRVSDSEFESNFIKRIFGCEDNCVKEIIWLLKNNISGSGCLTKKFAACENKITRSYFSFETLQLACEIQEMQMAMNNPLVSRCVGLKVFSGKSEKEHIIACKEIEDFREKVIRLRERSEEHLQTYMPEREVQEYLETVFSKILWTLNALLESNRILPKKFSVKESDEAGIFIGGV